MGDATTTVVGLDVSDRWTHVFQTEKGATEGGKRLRVKTCSKDIQAFLDSLPPRCLVVLEVGPHSRWINRLAQACRGNHEVVVANARRLRLIYAGRCKTDRLDAEALARVACLQPRLLYPIHHRGEEGQAHLNVLMARDRLVRVRTKLINTLRSLVKASGSEPLAGCTTGRFLEHHRERVLALSQPDLEALVRVLESVQAQISAMDACLLQIAKQYPVVDLLCRVHAVGPITALAFTLVVEDPDRFRSLRKIGAYLGLVPRIDQSGEVDRRLGITKEGNPMLRRLLVQCAQLILAPNGPDSALRRHGRTILCRLGKSDKGARKRAVVAVARKLAIVLLGLWRTGQAYEALPQEA